MPPLFKTVPQTKLECDGSKDFKCNVDEVQTVGHNNDLMVECMNTDPTDPNKPDGSFELKEGVFGEKSKAKFPVIYMGNKPLVVCKGAFEKPKDDSPDTSKTSADLFCKGAGFSGAVDKDFAKEDKKISRMDLMKAAKDGLTFLGSVPE